MINFTISSFLEIIMHYIYDWLTGHGLMVFLIIIGAITVNHFAGVVIESFIRKIVPPTKHEYSTNAERKREDTLIRIVNGTLRILVWIMSGLMVLSEIGINIGPLIAAAGVAGLAFGFGGQYLIKDLISGFFIILENQYRIGDVVCFEDNCGSVEDISLRATILRDLDGVVHYIPHGSIARVSNLSKEFARVNINLSISYNENLEKVIRVINKTGNSLAEDPVWKDKILKPIQFLRVNDFADSSVVVKVLGETIALEQWAVAGEFRKRIKIAFDKSGIEIPFPQTVVQILPKEAVSS